MQVLAPSAALLRQVDRFREKAAGGQIESVLDVGEKKAKKFYFYR
jgi:hypothetical protein